jgi:hypothetical protein
LSYAQEFGDAKALVQLFSARHEIRSEDSSVQGLNNAGTSQKLFPEKGEQLHEAPVGQSVVALVQVVKVVIAVTQVALRGLQTDPVTQASLSEQPFPVSIVNGVIHFPLLHTNPG